MDARKNSLVMVSAYVSYTIWVLVGVGGGQSQLQDSKLDKATYPAGIYIDSPDSAWGGGGGGVLTLWV